MCQSESLVDTLTPIHYFEKETPETFLRSRAQCDSTLMQVNYQSQISTGSLGLAKTSLDQGGMRA